MRYIGAIIILLLILPVCILDIIDYRLADSYLKIISITSAVIFALWLLGLIARFVLYKTVWAKNTISFPHENYGESLSKYMQNSEFADFLENDNLKLYFNNIASIYNIRLVNKKNNKSCEIQHEYCSKSKLISLWGLIQMNFNQDLTYSGLRFWLDGFDDFIIKKL